MPRPMGSNSVVLDTSSFPPTRVLVSLPSKQVHLLPMDVGSARATPGSGARLHRIPEGARLPGGNPAQRVLMGGTTHAPAAAA
mmetsp:Transcript_31506/g.71584  ORF Transcript_31506/g.71584 Transcript_31506/m.71584 type:complete len:83 (-) Transcript_31506:15-263(-)